MDQIRVYVRKEGWAQLLILFDIIDIDIFDILLISVDIIDLDFGATNYYINNNLFS